jgi:sec-independent protein translocase protein TatC
MTLADIPKQPDQLNQMPVSSHLFELRRRLIKVLIVIVLFVAMLPFAKWLYEILSKPLRAQLPVNASMIATDVTATFMAPFRLDFFVAIMLAMPYILYQIWQFIAPALYQRETYCDSIIIQQLCVVLFRHRFCLLYYATRHFNLFSARYAR